MKKLVLSVLVLFFCSWLTAQQKSQPIQGVVLVEVTPDMAKTLELRSEKSGTLTSTSSSQYVKTGVKSFDALSSSLKTTKMKRLYPYHPKYEARQQQAGLHLWYEVHIDEGISPEWAIENLELDFNVRSVEKVIPAVVHSTPKSTVTANDPLLKKQWHYQNTKQTGGAIGSDINLFAAWEKQMKADNVIVAVIDEGIDVTHPDLEGNLWINEAELNGKFGVDDDGNGYIDDIYGYNFVQNTGTIVACSHGTHVAGTVAASTNNNIGVAGVAGGTGNNDGARLMSIQAFLENPKMSVIDHGPGFAYAANNGAVIAQCSWGWNEEDNFPESTKAGIDYFIKWAGKDENGNPLPNTPMVGGIVIFATGNEGIEGNYYPARYDSVLAVTAISHDFKKAGYGNYGVWVDIVAPGGLMSSVEETGIYSTMPKNSYGYMQGTSQACPHVSGIAALVLAKYGSRTYTPEMLKQRLLFACNPEKVYEANPNFIGKLGIGLIDAAKALESDDGIAPDKVTDLQINLLGQNFIRLSFTAPADADNDNALQYEIRYSTRAITNSNYDNLPVISKSAKLAGQLDTFFIAGLKAETKYYFAQKSFDIWGNISEMSNILEVTTLGSPEIALSPDTLKVEIDASVSMTSTKQIEIKNNAASGGLAYTVNHSVVNDPRPIPPGEGELISSYLDPKGYVDSKLLGQSGLTTSFWVANQMEVTTDTYNLTHLKWAITTLKAKIGGVRELTDEPFVIRIVKGGSTPSQGEIIYSEECGFKSWDASDEIWDLGQQLTFTKGEKFWIMLCFPPQYALPMGVNEAVVEQYGPSLFSEDNGLSWTDINDVHFQDSYIPMVSFRLFGLSKQATTGEFVEISPKSGIVPVGSPATVNVTFNAENIIEGEYNTRINVTSDDVNNVTAHVPVKLVVKNHPSKYISEVSELNFGSLIINSVKDDVITIQNTGLGALLISNIEINQPGFVLLNTITEIKPKQQAEIKVRFAPTTVANIFGKIEITTNEGKKEIRLTGTGVNPPVLNVTPTTLTYTGNVGDEVTQQFKIKNTGAYKLTYSMPTYVGVSTMSFTDIDAGYTAKTSNDAGGPSASVWDDMSTAEDITRLVEMNRLYQVDLGFKMKYYDIVYDHMTVTSGGYVVMGDIETLPSYSARLIKPDGVGKIIAPVWYDKSGNFRISENGGKILYKKFKDYVVIEYNNFGVPDGVTQGPWGPQPVYGTGEVDVQLVMYNTGQIEYRYHNFNEKAWDQKLFTNTIIGLENEIGTDGIVIAHKDVNFLSSGDSLAIAFYPPAPKIVKAVSPASGTVIPGDEAVITVTMKADEDLVEGSYVNQILINTNDPLALSTTVTVNANVLAESKPVLRETEFDFGLVNRGYTKTGYIRIYNDGGKPYRVLQATSSAAEFTVTPTATSDTCSGFSSAEYKIEFVPTSAGNFEGVITFETDVAGMQYLNFAVKGSGLLNAAYLVEHSPLNLDYTLNVGEKVDTAIYIKSTGETNLAYSIGGNEWIRINQPSTRAGNQIDNTGYSWVDNTQDPSLQFEWLFTDNAVEQEIGWVTKMTYDLPFTFTFYGREYNSLILSPHGQLMFATPHGDNNVNAIYAQAIPIPRQDNVNNVICLMRTVLSPYKNDAMVKARVYTEDFEDKVVFSWVNMLSGDHSHMNDFSHATMQVILYKDGRIKFQYKDVEDALWKDKSIIGIENYDGTDGLELSFLEKYTKNNMAVMFTPGQKHELEPSKVHRYPITIDASGLYDGQYTGRILVNSNDPANKIDSVIVKLKVNGQHNLIIPDSVNFGTVYLYPNPSGWGNKNYRMPLVLKNTGTKAIKLKDIKPSPNPAGLSLISISKYMNAIQPGAAVEGQVSFTPQSVPANNRLDTTYQFIFDNNGVDEIHRVVITADVFYPPIADIDSTFKNKIHKVKIMPNAAADTTTFNVFNIGQSLLNYEWSVTYLDEGEFYSVAPNTRSVTLNNKSSKLAQSVGELQPANFANGIMPKAAPLDNSEFVDSLYYAGDYKNLARYPNPVDRDFGTRFRAGENGFNLTHVSAWYKAFSEKTALQILIMKGKDYETARTVYASKVFNATVAPDYALGKVEVNKLDAELYFYPGEYFWVIYRSNATDFYFGNMSAPTSIRDNFIFCLLGAGLGNMGGSGWLMRAYSAQINDTPSWISLSPAKGDVDADDQKEVDIIVDPSIVANNFGPRYARVDLTSNDPVQEDISIFVNMAINEAPKILYEDDRIYGESVQFTAPEDYEYEFPIYLEDPDDDAVKSFDYELTNEIEGRIKPEITFTKVNGNKYMFKFKTHYGSEGTWKYRFLVTDVNDLSYTSNLNLRVLHTNRFPQLVSLSDVDVVVKQSLVIDLNDAFMDHDDDEILYTVTSENDNIASAILIQDSKLYLLGVSEGTTKVTVIAKDGNEADDDEPTEASFNVNVTYSTPVASPMPDLILVVGNGKQLNLNDYFTDVEGEELTYTATSNAVNIASTSVNGSELFVNGVSEGTTSVIVKATNSHGLTVETDFTIEVVSEALGGVDGGLLLYPNPVVNNLHLESLLTANSKVEIRIYNVDGALMYRNEYASQTRFRETINVSNFPSGIYIIQYLVNGDKAETKRFMK